MLRRSQAYSPEDTIIGDMHLDLDPSAKYVRKSRFSQLSPPARRLIGVLLFLVCLIWLIVFRHDESRDGPRISVASTNGSDKKSRVAIVTFTTTQKSYTYLSLKNKAHYAKRHGYDFVVDYESHATRGVTWLKFDMIERLINAGTHEWIWWMDFDTLITNTTIPLMDIINESLANATNPADVDFLVNHDCNNLNDGSFIVRSSPRSLAALNAMRALHDREKAKGTMLNDQEAMRDFLKSDHKLTKHAMVIPQWKINAFPSEIGCYDSNKVMWAPGMLVVHFAGAWAHVKEKDPTGFLMDKYEDEIIWEDD